MRQTLRHEAATIRPILRVLFASVLVLSLFPAASRADDNAPSRRDAAKAQFERAEKAREALEARPESTRTLKDYTALVIEYQRVYLITSHAADVPASLNRSGRTVPHDGRSLRREVLSTLHRILPIPDAAISDQQVPRRRAAGHRAHRAGRFARFRCSRRKRTNSSWRCTRARPMPRKFAPASIS